MLKRNDLLEGKYEVLRQIQKGGMSIVYLALDSRLNKQWAIKELSKKSHPILIQSALAEANLIKKLDHPSIPRIVDIIDLPDSICIIMDYIEGKSLDFVLEEYGVPSQETVVDWALQILDILIYLHHQNPPILYLDLKPGNIMLQPDGRIKIIDFGIAREIHHKGNYSLGTVGYASMEQIKNEDLDQRSDIYSFGATLFHLLTGAHPQNGIRSIRSMNPNLSGGLDNIMLKCTKEKPSDRYQTCEELKYVMQHYEKEEDAYKKKMKRTVGQFITLTILSISICIMALSLSIYDVRMIQNDYEHLIMRSKNEENIDYLFKAIQTIPTQKEAYLTLIEFYKDTSFNQDQSNVFLSKVSSSLETFKEKNPHEYSDIAYEIGKLYWFYYPQANAYTMASNWFEESSKFQKDSKLVQISNIYVFIGTFVREVTKMRNEGSSTVDMYAEYFQNMNELFHTMHSFEAEQRIHLELDTLIVNSLESYIKDFIKAKIPFKDILTLYDETIQDVENMETDTDITTQIQNEILEKKEERRYYLQENYANFTNH